MSDTTATPTRADYLAKRCTHQDYYRAIARDGGVSFRPNDPFIERVRAALAAGDERLSTIPLGEWDSMTGFNITPLSFKLAEAFKARGDRATLAGLVCVYKEAARMTAEGADFSTLREP